ncbi:unnamed protein product, partial [marine sediment metagenome]
NDKSVEASGYSIKGSHHVTTYPQISKIFSIPNRNKCSLGFFINWSSTTLFYHVKVYVDDVVVFYMPYSFPAQSRPYWIKIVANLSVYKGQTKTIKIECYLARTEAPYNWSVWIDRIVMAGKD